MATTAKGYPYPVATDTPDVPRDVRALAAFLDTLPILATGQYGFGNISTGGSSGVATITFPVGRFTVAPVVAVGCLAASARCAVVLTGVTAASCQIAAYNGDTVTRAVSGYVIAAQ